MAEPTVDDFKRHIYRLADDYDVAIVEIYGMPPHNAKASRSHREIIIAPITDETTYMVALHEMGHVCAPVDARWEHLYSQDRDREIEAAAWKWARQRALLWTPLMEHVATQCEATYSEDAMNQHLTPEDQEIIALLGEERYKRLRTVAEQLAKHPGSKTHVEAFKLIVLELPDDVRKTVVAKIRAIK